MPLLSRNKPAASSSQQQQVHKQSQASQQQALCESPLFGIRRQIGAKLSSTLESSSTTSSSSAAAAAAARKVPQTAQELTTTIPQQITRKQIHYAFTIMDNDKDGMVNLRDLSQMLANLGLPIDEAILSHIMSTSVSKRGDHRISELEFLDWISHFIEVRPDETPARVGQQQHEQSQRPSSGSKQQSKGRGKAGPLKVARSSAASSSLVAQPSELAGQSARSRRGSGSGLALMRSLSSCSSSSNQSAGSSSEPQSEDRHKPSSQATEAADAEARDDLKAAFCVFDLDGDGLITVDEVRAGLRLLGEQWSNEELRQLFNRCSTTGPSTVGTQCISIDEFVQLLL